MNSWRERENQGSLCEQVQRLVTSQTKRSWIGLALSGSFGSTKGYCAQGSFLGC